MSERTGADKRLTRTKIHIGNFVDITRQLGQMNHPTRQEDIVPLLQAEIPHHADQVDVPTTFTNPVNRPLHLNRSVIDGGQRVRHRQFTIVVAVNPDGNLQDLAYGLDRSSHLFR